MKVFLIRGPRYYWPFINEYDNFLMPQSLACLAAVLKQAGIDVRVIDSAPQKIGWSTLRRIMEEEKPDIVGIGDSESLYCHEAVRVLNLARDVDPNVITVAGGAHFSNLIQESLQSFPIDFIVRGEGELTLLELVRELQKSHPDFASIKGIAFKRGNQIIETEPRPLVADLDQLPIPAYELMPMTEYGKSRFLFSPGGVTIHHSRGCIDRCKFCVWWVQMAERRLEGNIETLHPKWRTKSVSRTLEEIRLLYHKYNKRYMVFVDDSWNISQPWNDEFAEALIREKLKLGWFGFMRADLMLRDEKSGILEKLVRSGMSHICIGAERESNDELKGIGKNCYSRDIVKECLDVLRRKYPQVFRQVTFIVGIRGETKESLLRQVEYAKEIRADYPAFHAMTPVPGTEAWREAREKGWIEVKDFSRYDWNTPVISCGTGLTRDQVSELIYLANRRFIRISWIIKGLFSPYRIKRNMYIWWLLVAAKVIWDHLKQFVIPFSLRDCTGLVKPKWYDT